MSLCVLMVMMGQRWKAFLPHTTKKNIIKPFHCANFVSENVSFRMDPITELQNAV